MKVLITYNVTKDKDHNGYFSDEITSEKIYEISEITENSYLSKLKTKNMGVAIRTAYGVRFYHKCETLSIEKICIETDIHTCKYTNDSFYLLFKLKLEKEKSINKQNQKKITNLENICKKFDQQRVKFFNILCYRRDLKNVVKRIILEELSEIIVSYV